MTRRQKKAQADWAKAYAANRNAEPGFRAKTRAALMAATVEILKADIEARRARQMRRAA